METIAVVGLGYVGIPVALKIANAGIETIGIDIDKNKIDFLNKSIYPIEGDEPGIDELLEKTISSGKFIATYNYSDAINADAWLVCVQTPFLVDEFKPNFTALNGALKSIGENMKKGCLVVIESTIPPGTMQEVVIPCLEAYSGLRAGFDFSVGHCPERVMPGKLLFNLSSYGRALGGLDDKSHKLMAEIYSKITSGKLDKVNLKTAETVKTFENTYRDAEIAIANDFAIYCDNMGVDFFEIRDLVNQVESRNLHLPGGGVGGHCIPKDTWLLAYGSRGKYTPEFLIKAREVNNKMPIYVAKQVLDAAKSLDISPQDCKVAILGLSYLEESDDVRNSPSEVLFNTLIEEKMSVSVHDYFVKYHPSIPFSYDLEETISGVDILVVMVAHKLYKSIDMEYIKRSMGGNYIIDTRNVFDLSALKKFGFEYYTIGRGSSIKES